MGVNFPRESKPRMQARRYRMHNWQMLMERRHTKKGNWQSGDTKKKVMKSGVEPAKDQTTELKRAWLEAKRATSMLSKE